VGQVSQPQIAFNPAFQTVVVHEASVTRDGRKLDRLRDARLELMRREQRLEQLVIDGTETLLVLLNDVRVGEPVEVAYTIEGENPIYESRIATGVRLAWDTPIDLLHYRLIAPAGRALQVKSLAIDLQPERLVEGGNQVFRVVRTQVPGVAQEQGTPPWFKSYPAVFFSEYANWAEVETWAKRLFATPPGPNAGLAARLSTLRASGLAGEALAAETLRFVQDEVRYFSVSLGESSHRPKPPERTLADRVGDCKDKVVLLNALLTELGFEAKPALVSMARNRGLAEFLPSHEEFDHVITRLDLNGATYYLDATVSGQGTTLAARGYFPYGRALVVGAGTELQVVAEPAQALNRLEFEQRWDFSKPGMPVRLKTVMRAEGLIAERFRAVIAMGGDSRLAEALAGAHTRLAPGLKADGPPAVADDRQANRLELTQSFEHPYLGQYASGGLDVEFTAIELFDALNGPPEARRRTPFLLDQPRTVESRIVVTGPRPFAFRPPPPNDLSDRHFHHGLRVEVAGPVVTFLRRVERRKDEVQPPDLESFRESLLKARQLSGGRLRLPLVDTQPLVPQFEQIDRRLRAARGFRADALHGMLARNEAARVLDTEVLRQIDAKSPLAVQVLATRAQTNNLLGDFAAGLSDADAALASDAASEPALEARAVALTGAGRVESALATFARLENTGRRAMAVKWMGALELLRGRPAEAEKLLRVAVDTSGGEDRDFAVLWLYLAAEQQAGRGKAAVAQYIDQADPKKLVGALLHHMDGRLDRDAVLQIARERADMERLNLAEASFYFGQQAFARGQRDEALRWFTRAVETGAVPYREVTFARMQIEGMR
jgi:tetratricopeptide (TPR) repeat protein